MPTSQKTLLCLFAAACLNGSAIASTAFGQSDQLGDVFILTYGGAINFHEENGGFRFETIYFGENDAPSFISDSDLNYWLSIATPDEPLFVHSEFSREYLGSRDEVTPSFFSTDAVLGVDYTGDPEDPYSWTALTPRDVFVDQYIGDTNVYEIYGDVFTEYFFLVTSVPEPSAAVTALVLATVLGTISRRRV